MNKSAPTVLIADDEPEIRSMLERFLLRSGYNPVTAADGREALGRTEVTHPDIVLLDVNMPGMDGFSVCRKLRENPSTRLTPILMLTARAGVQDKVDGLGLGADDYVTKPFDMAELQARIETLLKRRRNMVACNPLTQLPGAPMIREEIESRLARNEKFAVAYLDLDHFKAYNDVYGYHQGDLVIQWTAATIQSVIQQGPWAAGSFLGHIGGDDFILIAPLSSIHELCERVTKTFDQHRNEWYNLWHRIEGGIRVKDRLGKWNRFPLMTLSIGVATNENRAITHYAEIAQICSEMKKFVKSRAQKSQSSTGFDKRTN